MSKPTRETIRKRIATRRRNAARRRAMAAKRAENNPGLGHQTRLAMDGASSIESINRRMQWLVQEWKLPQHPNLKKPSKALSDYVQAHDISYDWLLYGDLKGLQGMMQRRHSGKPTDSLSAKLGRLSESQRQVIGDIVRQLLDEARQGAPTSIA